MSNPKIALEDILDELMLEDAKPSYQLLTEWTVRFPEHADALARFFTTWALHSESDETDLHVDEDSLANRGVSYALDLLHRRQAMSGSLQTGHTGLRLIQCTQAAGLSPDELAQRCELDESIIDKLNRCLLTDIPQLCIDRLAAATGAANEEIRSVVTRAARRAAGGRHKSKGKPRVVTERFVDAVNASLLSETTKRFWLEIAAAEFGERNPRS